MDKETIDKLKENSSYIRNVEYGKPRSGHPEGKVAAHILELEDNLTNLFLNTTDVQLSENEYWKLQFLIHVHDTFKAESIPNSPILDPNSHASLAVTFAKNYTDDKDLLNMIQYHDEGYALWRQYDKKGSYDEKRLENLIRIIQDWRLFLLFMIVDNDTVGKNIDSLKWFLDIVTEKVGNVELKGYLRKR